MALVHLPQTLVKLFPGAPRTVQVEAQSVSELMDYLDQRWPGMGVSLCASGPTIREHINVFVDGERTTIEGRVEPGSVVHVMTAVSGG